MPKNTHLMTGEEYKASLRDGRTVLVSSGERLDDITTHNQFASSIDRIAQYYDAQHDPAHQELLTHVDEETGMRSSRAWQVPRTHEDLEKRRELARFSTYHFMGVYGRPTDYGSLNSLGLLSLADRIKEQKSEWAENVESFVEWGRAGNLMSADVVADVQSDRSVPAAERPGRLRKVATRKDGIIVSGAKPAASVAAQGHIGTILTILSPGADPDAILFAVVPVNAPGLTMVTREKLVSEGPNHPLDSLGEEADNMLIFDNVFIPNEHIFSFGRLEMLPLYHEIGAIPLWHILTRVAYKAEIFAGTAQLVADILGTSQIPQVRDTISEITAYATNLMAHVIAAERTAKLKNGVLVPNERYVTTGRLLSIQRYPRVLQMLRDLSGQGMISRFSEAQFNDDLVGHKMREYLPGMGVSAEAKNKVFDFLWDLTSGPNALRTALFENVNSTPEPAIRGQIFRSEYRAPWREHIVKFLDLDIERLGGGL